MKSSQESKSFLITGATDGIGLETAKKLKSLNHKVTIHGRNLEKLKKISAMLEVDYIKADFSDLGEVKKMAFEILEKFPKLDVLINNAGVFKTSSPKTSEGLDSRFVVNTLAPYLLTKKLLPILDHGRVINLSSAAQSSVDIEALKGEKDLDDFEAYAQSKLAIAMWTRYLAEKQDQNGPTLIAVNPASLLGTKMVREGFHTHGNDINIGVDILVRLSLDDEHLDHNGEYYDNDRQKYSPPKADGLNVEKTERIIETMEQLI